MFTQLTGERTKRIYSLFLFFQRHFLKVNLFFTVFYVNDSVVLTKKNSLFLHDFYSCVNVISAFLSQKKKANKVLQRWPFYVSLHFVRPRELTPYH